MSLKRQLGLDILEGKYAYASDPVMGHTSEQKIPDTWVSTTCGYCSVGCGMFIGVRDGRAVSVRGNPEHLVNVGKLCPKGLAEHYTIAAEGRLTKPLLHWAPVTWDHALGTMVDRFRSGQKQYGP